ncbi:MAG: FMN-binding negative transcriptional regulator [Kiloniellales bacterium]
MYVPDMFKLDDPAVAVEVMRAHDFALLVTAPGGRPQASHLPFLLDETRGPKGTLLAHMARANPQWRDFEGEGAGEALVIFQGPHGYVSPSWYPPGNNVPTWNYLAVHAYGRPRVLATDAARALIERLVATHEGGREPSWTLAGQDEKYIAAMLRGIVAFEIPIERLEAKAKLSQNKDAATRAKVVAALEAEGGENASEVAAAMRRLVLDDLPVT